MDTMHSLQIWFVLEAVVSFLVRAAFTTIAIVMDTHVVATISSVGSGPTLLVASLTPPASALDGTRLLQTLFMLEVAVSFLMEVGSTKLAVVVLGVVVRSPVVVVATKIVVRAGLLLCRYRFCTPRSAAVLVPSAGAA